MGKRYDVVLVDYLEDGTIYDYATFPDCGLLRRCVLTFAAMTLGYEVEFHPTK
tara:strand:+ start:439 stop:597 length:159 start_codon:yes stop_codon:yes gene_type:complete